MITGRWLLPLSLFSGFAFGEVAHDIRIEIDPDARRVLVEDTVSMTGGGTLSIGLPRMSGIVNLFVDGSAVNDHATRATARSPVRVSYIWHVPSRSADGSPAAMLDPDGGFLPAYPRWLPHSLDAPARYRFTVVTPAAYRSVATGKLHRESLSEEGNRAAFELTREDGPPSLFVGPYQVRERYSGDVRLRTYFYPDQTALEDEYLTAVADYLDRYESLIGRYPYADFHVVAGPLPVGLAFRNLTYVSRQILHLPFMRGRSLAHEVLHAWWGSAVRPDYANGNWSEGLTTYMADYAIAEQSGKDFALQMRLGWLRDYGALPAERDHALRAFRGRTHDASQVVGYGKTAYVFHMLRRRLGEPGFRFGLRRFWESNRFRTAGWDELERAFEKASGQELDKFFAQWLDRAGAPRLDLADANAVSSDGEHTVEIELEQSAPWYTLRIPVTVETASGKERFTLPMDEQRVRAAFSVTDRPLGIAVDPEFDLFRRLEVSELPVIIRDTTLGDDVATVLPSGNVDETLAAARLANRLLDLPAVPLETWNASQFRRPLLLIGVGKSLPKAFARVGIEAIPPNLTSSDTARVWAVRNAEGWPRLAILADDLASLEALTRPLPHYGQESWLSFRASTVTASGVWSASDSPLRARFSDLGVSRSLSRP